MFFIKLHKRYPKKINVCKSKKVISQIYLSLFHKPINKNGLQLKYKWVPSFISTEVVTIFASKEIRITNNVSIT